MPQPLEPMLSLYGTRFISSITDVHPGLDRARPETNVTSAAWRSLCAVADLTASLLLALTHVAS